MRKNKTTIFADILEMIAHRFRLLRKDRICMGVLISSILLFLFIIQTFITSAKEQSALPIGIIDKDRTEESMDFLQRLEEVSSLRVIYGDKQELNELLLDELIYAYFIIDEGFEEKIQAGYSEDLISVHYLGENRFATLLADVLAGELMYPVTLYYTMDYYNKLPYEGDKLSRDEYKDYVDGLMKYSEDFDFSFDIRIVDQENEYELDNSLIYNQLILGMIGILLSLVAMAYMAICVKEKELGILGRFKISKYGTSVRDSGTMLSFLCLGILLSTIFSFLIQNKLNVRSGHIYFQLCFLMIEFTITMGGIFLFLSKCFSKMVSYQLSGTILILLTSIMGCYQLISGFTNGSGALAKIIPNNWFIQGFTDIIVKKDMNGILLHSHKVLGIMILAIILGLFLVNLILEKKEEQ